MKKLLFKNDKYRKVRGGYTRLLEMNCVKCGEHLFYYQKDGPGILKRLYLDRIIEPAIDSKSQKKPLICRKCQEIIGIPYIYKKEKRPAFRLFIGSISKKIVKNKNSTEKVL